MVQQVMSYVWFSKKTESFLVIGALAMYISVALHVQNLQLELVKASITVGFPRGKPTVYLLGAWKN